MDKSFFALKKMLNKAFLLFLICNILFFLKSNIVYANSPVISETPNVTIFEQYRMALENQNNIAEPTEYIDSTSIYEQYRIANEKKNMNPIDMQNYTTNYNEIINNPYRDITYNATHVQLLTNYYNAELLKSGNLTNFHEENYFYTDGQIDKSIYNGVIGYNINDFDGDFIPELAIFKIRTNMLTENYAKEIILDIVKINNGLPQLLERRVILQEDFLAETIELDISVKRYNDIYRLYVNYFEKKVSDETVMNKFLAIDVRDGIHIVAEANYDAFKQDYYYYDDNYDFTNIVVDAGIVVKDDDDIINRAFINDDVSVKPITTFYRVNESMKDGYLEHYIENYYEDFIKYGFLKIRYGYTNIIMR